MPTRRTVRPPEAALRSISELVERVGTTKRVVEHAESRGLLRPTARTPQGYKLYGPVEEETLRLIVTLYDVGFSAARIKALFMEPPARRAVLLDEHRGYLQTRAAEAAARLRRFDRARATLTQEIDRRWRAARRPGASTNEGIPTTLRPLARTGYPNAIRPAA